MLGGRETETDLERENTDAAYRAQAASGLRYFSTLLPWLRFESNSGTES